MSGLKPIPKQEVLQEMASYGNCSDFLHDMMYEYHEKIIGISLNDIYKIYDEKNKFERQYYNKTKRWPSFKETYDFIKNLIDDKNYYKL